jgi:hypothetical protein
MIDGVVVKTGIPEYPNEIGEGVSNNRSISYGNLIMKDIADHLRVYYATVSRAVKSVEAGMHHCKTPQFALRNVM